MSTSSLQVEISDDEVDRCTVQESLLRPVVQGIPPTLISVPSARDTAKEVMIEGRKSKVEWATIPGQPKGTYLDLTLPPINSVIEAFEDLTRKALRLGLQDVLNTLSGRTIKIATMCSGTETPIVALDFIRKCLKDLGHDFNYEHTFSSEIVPWKQSWILRNFEPNILFRDITEMYEGEAMTVYGEHARIPPPGSVHILIAGFACVDFSTLNNRRKDLVVNMDEIPPEVLLEKLGGESSITLTAILKYARHYRPPIIILENILGASWNEIEKLFGEIEYSISIAKLDTKYFYIPQTRQRGYMICINTQHAKSIGGLSKSRANAAVEKWSEALAKMMRPASSPVDEFLFKDNQFDLQLAMKNMVSESGTQWETDFAKDWSVCWGRYQRFREHQGLGIRTPYTNWRSGVVMLPEHAHATWLQKQPNRVKDTMDCLHLLSAQKSTRNYDASYKSRFPDASQNVDRSIDMAKPGIVGCITPNNIIFHTGKARPLAGLEFLQMQGINRASLLISRETQKQLRDLAGNAMTTTVVGSAMLSGLIAAFDAIEPKTWGKCATPADSSWLGDRFTLDPRSELVLSTTINLGQLIEDLSTANFLELADQTVRKCYCEGQASKAQATIVECEDCLHSSCIDCCGNPTHNYTRIFSGPRRDPLLFIKTAFKFLPAILRLQGFKGLGSPGLDIFNGMIVKEKLAIMAQQFLGTSDCSSKSRIPAIKKTCSDQKISLNSTTSGHTGLSIEGCHQKTQLSTFHTDASPEAILRHFTLSLNHSEPRSEPNETYEAFESITDYNDCDIKSTLIDLVWEDEELVMQRPERTHIWTITYESEHLKLKLELHSGGAEWLLFVKSPHGLAAGSSIRALLDQPIATMRPIINDETTSLLDGQWKSHTYSPQVYPIRIQAQGYLVPSWKAELGLKAYGQGKIYNGLAFHPLSTLSDSLAQKTLDELSGQYWLQPKCGTATRSLHRHVSRGEARTRYLFLESKPNQPSDLDEYVIALQHERLPNNDTRRIIARITSIISEAVDVELPKPVTEISQALMRRLSPEDRSIVARYLTETPDVVSQFIPELTRLLSPALPNPKRLWRPSLKQSQDANFVVDYQEMLFAGALQPAFDDETICTMPVAAEVFSRPNLMSNYASKSPEHQTSTGDCRHADRLLLRYRIPWHGRNPDGYVNYRPILITEMNQHSLDLDLEWLINRIPISAELTSWNSLALNTRDHNCSICSPPAPTYIHRQMPTGGLLPMEDPEAVTKYLELWKRRPVPLTLALQRSRHKKSQQNLCITINVKCLLHRLLASLPNLLNNQYFNTEAAWRISTDVVVDRGGNKIGSLRVHDCTRELPLHYEFGASEHRLREDQARVFRWMKGRDTVAAASFKETTIEENVSSHLRWCLEVQASRSMVVRGGLCADHVGFGKTVVVLATIRDHMHEARREAELAIKQGMKSYIPVKATLVLVPGPLAYQWGDEISKFWTGCIYLMITSMEDLQNCSIEDIAGADVIITSVDIFQQDRAPAYTNRIAEIAGAANPAPFILPRQYTEWLKSMNRNISAFVRDLQDEELNYDDCAERLKERSYQYKDTAAQYQDPSKRLRGRQFLINQRAKILKTTRHSRHSLVTSKDRFPGEIQGFEAQPVSVHNTFGQDDHVIEAAAQALLNSNIPQKVRNEDSIDAQQKAQSGDKIFYGPVFSMFRFHRKVVDEISYVTPYQEAAIRAIASNVTWLLSGTARLRDVMDVKNIASMIGVHIGSDDDSEGHVAEGNRKLVDERRSETEKIEATKVVHTEAWHKRRLIIAQTFLDRFARTNQVELPPSTRVRVKEVVWATRLPGLQAILYHESRCLIVSEGFKDNVTFIGHGRHDRSLRLSFVLHHTNTVEEALVKAAFFIPRAEGYSMMQHRCHELPNLSYKDVLEARLNDVSRISRSVIRRTEVFMRWLEASVDPNQLDKKDANFLLDVLKRAVWLLSTRLMRSLQDVDASEQLRRIHARASLMTTENRSMTPKEARRRLDRLGKLVDAMVSAMRSLRYLQNARRVQEMAWNAETTYFTDDLDHTTHLDNARLNGLCGHLICERCVQDLPEPRCPVLGCGAGASSQLLIHPRDVGESTPYSEKSSEKIQTVINIAKALNKDAQVLVFCQWHDMNEILLSHLLKADITASYVRDGETSTASKVAGFKTLPPGHPQWTKLLILNPLSSTAAGHNLQNVNAIVFLTPLSATSVNDYKAAYTQAIGRAARFGQKDIVKVYHLLASRTIEINIHESRRGKKLFVKDGKLLECPAGCDHSDGEQGLAVDGYIPFLPA